MQTIPEQVSQMCTASPFYRSTFVASDVQCHPRLKYIYLGGYVYFSNRCLVRSRRCVRRPRQHETLGQIKGKTG